MLASNATVEEYDVVSAQKRSLEYNLNFNASEDERRGALKERLRQNRVEHFGLKHDATWDDVERCARAREMSLPCHATWSEIHETKKMLVEIERGENVEE